MWMTVFFKHEKPLKKLKHSQSIDNNILLLMTNDAEHTWQEGWLLPCTPQYCCSSSSSSMKPRRDICVIDVDAEQQQLLLWFYCQQ